jgi:hypothetical protein
MAATLASVRCFWERRCDDRTLEAAMGGAMGLGVATGMKGRSGSAGVNAIEVDAAKGGSAGELGATL